MERYIGLDVHTQSCSAAVLGPSGKRLRSEVLETSGEVLIPWLRGIGGRRHLCLEEGTQSAWLYEVLEPHVHELVVAQPRASRGPKSDARDAWSLAEQLRLGSIERRVFKAPGTFARLRAAVRGHDLLTRDMVRAKNRLRAIFRSRGLTEVRGLYTPARRDANVLLLPEHQRHLAGLLGQQLDALAALRQQAQQRLADEAGKHPIVGRLASAPGIGPIRAAQIVAIGVTPHRFRTTRQFWSYCGLGIVTRSSADWERQDGRWVRAQVTKTRGLNRNRHPMLKSVFKGAATTVIGHMHDNPLCQGYQRRLEANIKPNLAKLTLARQLAAVVLAMWKTQEVYDPIKHRHQKAT